MSREETKQPRFTDYPAFARAVYETGVLTDPWHDGRERFGIRGALLTPGRARRLAVAAERVAYLHQELVDILFEHPKLLRDFYHLTDCQQAMWEASGSLWHGMARADLFICEDGSIACCELNSDTPSGQPEAVLLNRLLHDSQSRGRGGLDDPNVTMADRYVAMLRGSHAKGTDKPLNTVGIIYPTELTEDLALVSLLTRWLQAAGLRVICGSPFNLRRTRRGVEVLGVPVDLIVRHYKTDWWGERIPVWKDAPGYADPEPLYGELGALISAEMDGEVTVVNPFGSVVTQNKLSLAFFWEEQGRFSPRARAWIRNFIPETFRMTSFDLRRLRDEQGGWVIKSNYGCEGEETVCGPYVNAETWQKALEQARAEHFVVQRFFNVRPDEDGRLANYGVYLLGGRACGFFTRLSPQSTGYAAVTVPTFVGRRGVRS